MLSTLPNAINCLRLGYQQTSDMPERHTGCTKASRCHLHTKVFDTLSHTLLF